MGTVGGVDCVDCMGHSGRTKLETCLGPGLDSTSPDLFNRSLLKSCFRGLIETKFPVILVIRVIRVIRVSPLLADNLDLRDPREPRKISDTIDTIDTIDLLLMAEDQLLE